MILPREYYADLSWWKWLVLRVKLSWWRYSGGFARALGADGERAWQLGSLNMNDQRGLVSFTETLVENELRLAQLICPTDVIQHDAKNKWRLEVARCISCGLCYPLAPQSLAPQTQGGSVLPLSSEEVVDIAKTEC